MGTIVITGSASGMGAATRTLLDRAGHRVIGVDLRDADVVADLGTAEGRRDALAEVAEASGGALDAALTFAGVIGMPNRSGTQVVSVNYFGTIELIEGLRPLLAAAPAPAAVCISSNSTTCQPNIPADIVEACLDGDEPRARALAEGAGGIATYGAAKTAISWWVRGRAPRPEWIGEGITLNAIAPGYIATPMTEQGRADPEMAKMLDMFPIPAGRAGQPEEIAALAAFLVGPDARFFVGSVLFCDGGSDALLRPRDWPSIWRM